MAKKAARLDGGYMALSALATGLLANGLPVVDVAGYVALGYIPIVFSMHDIMTMDIFGIGADIWIAIVMVMMAAITTGTLLN